MESINNVVLITDLKPIRRFFVKSGENKTFVLFLAKKGNLQGRLEIIIRGKNADIRILGIIIGSLNQKISLYTFQDHQKEGSVSDLLIKSVLFNNSRLSYEGLIRISRGAQKSNAYQKNQNLLMSPTSMADSRPKLEILANDVRCTHGATVGKIDPEILYYLGSRGISQNTAEKLVIEGFFKDVLDRIRDKKIESYLTAEINKSLENIK